MSKKAAYNSWPPPPPDSETDEEHRTRLKIETDAKSKSDFIDHQLREEWERQKKTPGVKVLLLGQSESGKSTVLKNFQLLFAPKAFELEAVKWRPVIQLNLVRSVNLILDFISTWNQTLCDTHPHHQVGISSSLSSPKIRTLCFRLAPLRTVEEGLIRTLSRRASPEFQPRPFHALAVSKGQKSEDEPDRWVLVALGEDIAALWSDESLRQSLKLARVDLEEQHGFFLDHAVRVTREDYKPSQDDVLRARVTTLGPETHTIIPEGMCLPGRSIPWTIYDVGGSRNQRVAWAQFFDDVNAVTFLAPLSAFNQPLDEDKTVNRLADSLRLWRLVSSNKILASVEFVLLLNKIDILDSKLKSGIQFSSFVSSYINQPNDKMHVTQYLLNSFVSIHKQHSPKPRKLHTHFTCAVDVQATANIIKEIQDFILMKMLKQAELL